MHVLLPPYFDEMYRAMILDDVPVAVAMLQPGGDLPGKTETCEQSSFTQHFSHASARHTVPAQE